MKTKLTLKQEAFCQAYIETGNASEAYRRAYGAKNQKPETVNRNAFNLTQNSKILARLAELKAEHAKRHNLTVDDLLTELEEARQAALKASTPQASAAVAGTMGKARLLGYDKQIIAGDPDKPILQNITVSFVVAQKPQS
ncbi:MAG: terminase small subunit [Nitrosospira sp. 56-18]|jgi:phage terminase small subunit|nr:MAG: terminase small subunit [Nitrosospira sp. 56-18]